MQGEGNLTERDHVNMDAFLGHVFDAYKAGEITKEKAIASVAHVITAVDKGNHAEATLWFEQGRKFIKG
jgi:hypothetical protein